MDQPYKYYLANEPVNGNLFVSDPIKRQLLIVKNLEQLSDPKTNFKPSSGFCSNIRIDSNDCQAEKNINYPKAFAYDLNGVMYFIDSVQTNL